MIPADLNSSPVATGLMIASIAMMVLVYFNVVDVYSLFFNQNMIFQYNEYWRLFTSLLFYGTFEIKAIIHLLTFTRISSSLEASTFAGRKCDFVIFFLFGAISAWIDGLYTHRPFFGRMTASYVLYYWSKIYSDNQIQLNGIPLPMKASYAPIVSTAIGLISGGWIEVADEIAGIVTGHLYYYLHDVLAARYGTSFLSAPRWLRSLCHEVKDE